MGAFTGLGSLFDWTETGAWMAGIICLAGGIAAMVTIGERLAIDRFWTGLGALIACVATPAWGLAVVYTWFLVYCNEGCFS